MKEIVTKNLTQRDLEEIELQLGLLASFRPVGSQRYYGSYVRAAIAAGWYGDSGVVETVTTGKGDNEKIVKRYLLDSVDVGDMSPKRVGEAGRVVEAAYQDAVTPDPN